MIKIFCFGSNTTGRHGKGAALTAKKYWGAIYNQGEGLQGSSYAIPTKNGKLQTLPLTTIKSYINTFLNFAKSHSALDFMMTAIGTGLAGYTHDQIAPMFKDAPFNVTFPPEWRPFLGENYNYHDGYINREE
jgi:hypothetical protein